MKTVVVVVAVDSHGRAEVEAGKLAPVPGALEGVS
jgi:hypothetical protein